MMIKNYYHDKELRNSMSELANKTFGLDFELLYQKGCWSKVYSCYSILEDDKIVSNVSFHKLEIEKDNKKYTAMSIGSVMTYPEYRGKGYARQLMDEVLKDHKVDVVFLSANENVTEFYPRFGFKPVKHIKYKDLNTDNYVKGTLGRKLDIEKDFELIDSYVKKRLRNSKNMYVHHDDYLKMFYMLYLYNDHIYLHDDAIIVCHTEEDVLYVHDIYMIKPVNIYELVGPYVKDASYVHYSFEVELEGLTAYEDVESYLFVKTTIESLQKSWSYPGTSVT